MDKPSCCNACITSNVVLYTEFVVALQQYNGVTQLKVSDMVLLEGEDANEFLPKSDKDAKAMEDELKAVLQKHIKSSYFKSLCNAFYADKAAYTLFKKSSAAKSVHHAYIHGLLEHTLSMVKLSALICDFYGKENVNKELTVMGALLAAFFNIFSFKCHIK